GQPDAVSGCRFVEAHAAFQQYSGHLFRDSRTVVRDCQLDACTAAGAHGQLDAGAAPLAGVVEEISCKFEKIAAVAAEDCAIRDVYRYVRAFVLVNLQQALNQPLQLLLDSHRSKSEAL